ncbi:IS3 family transposase [Psychrobacter sp.]
MHYYTKKRIQLKIKGLSPMQYSVLGIILI